MKLKQIKESSYQRKEEENEESLYKDLGIFIGYTLDGRTTEAIRNFCEDKEIPNCLNEKDFHVTLIASESYDQNFEPEGVLNTPVSVFNFILDIWKSEDNKSILVAKFESEELTSIYNDILDEYKLETKYDDFIPHFTISYDIEQFDLKEKHQLEFNEYVPSVDLVEQYAEPLDDEWTEKYTATSKKTTTDNKNSKEKKQ